MGTVVGWGLWVVGTVWSWDTGYRGNICSERIINFWIGKKKLLCVNKTCYLVSLLSATHCMWLHTHTYCLVCYWVPTVVYCIYCNSVLNSNTKLEIKLEICQPARLQRVSNIPSVCCSGREDYYRYYTARPMNDHYQPTAMTSRHACRALRLPLQTRRGSHAVLSAGRS